MRELDFAFPDLVDFEAFVTPSCVVVVTAQIVASRRGAAIFAAYRESNSGQLLQGT